MIWLVRFWIRLVLSRRVDGGMGIQRAESRVRQIRGAQFVYIYVCLYKKVSIVDCSAIKITVGVCNRASFADISGEACEVIVIVSMAGHQPHSHIHVNIDTSNTCSFGESPKKRPTGRNRQVKLYEFSKCNANALS